MQNKENINGKRNSMDVKEAIKNAYSSSSHTILTSAIIMILLTGILSYAFSDPAVGQICQTISKGALSATIIILFILPGTLVTFDRFIFLKKSFSKDIMNFKRNFKIGSE
jgi:predicted RND superfamily exporter protein